jgi:hypothetical protein
MADASATLQAEQSNDGFLRIISNQSVQNNGRLLTLAEKGDLAGVREFLAEGRVDNDHRGLGGANALHYASHRGHAAVTAELLRSEFYVNARNDSGETPLHLAVYNGHLLIVEQLLDKGADINSINNYNETPLIYAAQKSMPALVRILLSRGADADIEDRYGDKAVDHASDSRTCAMFSKVVLEAPGTLQLDQVIQVFGYLGAKELARCSMVCGKWHRASECEALWNKLGVRRWEVALQSSLGFGPVASASFRPKTGSRKKSFTRSSSTGSTG